MTDGRQGVNSWQNTSVDSNDNNTRPSPNATIFPDSLGTLVFYAWGWPGVLDVHAMKEIPLTQGKVAIVDDEDYDRVATFKWYYLRGYALRGVRKPKHGIVYMHRFILDAPDDKQVDHSNGDGLDNRRCNIRLCSRSENAMNTGKRPGMSSRFKGVSWDKRWGKWIAQISVHKRTIFRAGFDTEEEAYAAYCAASAKYHGEFGRTA